MNENIVLKSCDFCGSIVPSWESETTDELPKGWDKVHLTFAPAEDDPSVTSATFMACDKCLSKIRRYGTLHVIHSYGFSDWEYYRQIIEKNKKVRRKSRNEISI